MRPCTPRGRTSVTTAESNVPANRAAPATPATVRSLHELYDATQATLNSTATNSPTAPMPATDHPHPRL